MQPNFLQSDLVFSFAISAIVFLFVIITLRKGIIVVPQSQVYVVERFGKYVRTLSPGLSLIIPYLSHISHRVSILERQLPKFNISVITKDNVEVDMKTTVFFRVVDASRSVYRIRDIDTAIHTAASSVVRSAAGKLELDELQSSRDSMNHEIARNLQQAAEVWGVEITRTEITDVIIDEQTRDAQRQQLNAERERRAIIARAEGDRRAIELAADAELYQAQRAAEAIRVTADANAYSITIQAEAEAGQTRVIAEAIAAEGQPAIDYEILKQQVEAIGKLASAETTKTLILPSNVTGVLGGIEAILSNRNASAS